MLMYTLIYVHDMASKILHDRDIYPFVIAIAEEASGIPTLCR